MPSEVMTRPPQGVQQQLPATAPTLLDIIQAVVQNPDVDVTKFGQLLEFQMRVEAREAERQYNQDFAEALREMPRISKNGVIDMGGKGKIPFAKYEDLDRAIRPIESRHGFTRSFMTEPSGGESGITVTVKLSHRGGHSEKSSRHMPPDPGPGRNAMQAIGSAGSYAKRYLTLDIWNIVCEGQDVDGHAWVTDPQIAAIENLIAQCATVEESASIVRDGFLKYMHAKVVSEVHARDFDKAVAVLEGKKRKVGRQSAPAPVQEVERLPDPIEPVLGTRMRCKGKIHEVYADTEGMQRWREVPK